MAKDYISHIGFHKFWRESFDKIKEVHKIFLKDYRKNKKPMHIVDLHDILKLCRCRDRDYTVAHLFLEAFEKSHTWDKFFPVYFDLMYANRSILGRVCVGCHVDVFKIGEYGYMLTKGRWKKYTGEKHRCFFCVGCLENKIGRKLNRRDFNWNVPLNSYFDNNSTRLLERKGVL